MSLWTARGVAILAAAWLLLILAAPALWTPMAGTLYLIGSVICHQLPERSFHLQGAQLPVCARCFGLYGGGALGGAIAVASCRGVFVSARRRSRSTIWMASLAAAIPTLITVVAEWGLRWPVSNAARAVAAVPFGATVAFVVVGALATLHYDSCVQPRPIGSSQRPTST